MAPQSDKLLEEAGAILRDRREARVKQDQQLNNDRSQQAREMRQMMQTLHDRKQGELREEWNKEDEALVKARAEEDKKDLARVISLLNPQRPQDAQIVPSRSIETFNSLLEQLSPLPVFQSNPQYPQASRHKRSSSSPVGRFQSTTRRRMNGIIPRAPAQLEFATIQVVDKSNLRKLKEMEVFDGDFLAHVLNYKAGSQGWVIPFADTRKKKQLVKTRGAIWVMNSASHSMLPAEVGDHGLIMQFEEPREIKQIVPLFIGEPQTSDQTVNFWYAGEYSTSGGEKITYASDPAFGTINTWVLKLWNLLQTGDTYCRDGLREALGKEDLSSVTPHDITELMIPKVNQPAVLPIYVRVLTFESYDENMYKSLVEARKIRTE